MIRNLLLSAFLLLTFLPSQAQPVFRIDSLPAQGVLLNKGWKWHAGDNPNFAKPEFDDSTWEGIDPTKTIPELSSLNLDKPLWLRLHFRQTTPTLLALVLKQSGATTLFLNGRQLTTYGEVGVAGQGTIAYSPVNEYLLMSLDSAENVLAVRYYFQKDVNYFWNGPLDYPLFLCHVFNVNRLSKNQDKQDYIWQGFNIGVPFILFLIYFTIFLFYTSNKANLYFSLWGLCNSISSFLWFQALNTPLISLQNQYSFLASSVFGLLANFALFCSTYTLLNQQIKAFLWLFGAICVVASLYPYLINNNSPVLNFIVTVLYAVLVIYMGADAKRRGNQGGIYVIMGIGCFILFWTIFLFDVGGNKNAVFANITFHVAALSLPVTVATLLGLALRNTNKMLIKQIKNIEALSVEKQHILATQNKTLEQQVEARTAELKASQAQLIQKEKLASLGELTAGIAHEIQNPLNFVNNFSEVSTELVSELKDEIDRGDTAEAKAIADDLTQNLQKITLHGGRASAIVKGMLEHSRTSTGEKQPTDLNALADEYMRLAYQGQRGKDKTFHAELVTDFDVALPTVEVVAPEIGRVLLNLFNNAFYAVHQRQKTAPAGYQPTVSVSTRRNETGVEIHVSDNGTGIPEAVKAKIFQPFFTTKPTGEGTGLGLSLSYDIITKGHGGTLTVESAAGEGTTFIIGLPQKTSA